MKEYINFSIDGVPVKAEKGETILQVAKRYSIDIPTLCHDDRVAAYGACGVCVVEAEGLPKLMRSCATKPAEGWKILTNSDRVQRARRFSLQMLMSDHTGDCKAPCSLACPAGTDCQAYVGLIANGDIEEAARVIKTKIPLPASIGRVCPHPCEKACRRGLVEEPISIASLKAYAGSKILDNAELPDILAATGKKVNVIGGGPGGLSAAYYLALKGHDVTVYDMMPKMGGMLRYGIPQYRLPKEVLDKEIALIERAGVKLKNNVKLGVDFTLEDLRKSADAVIVAVGAWVSSKMRTKGEDLEGVYGGIDFLRSVIMGNPFDIGEKVAVCGGGNTAMDACRTAVRLGAKEVYIVYRRTMEEMPADQLEIDEAMEEGVTFKFLTNPDEILSENGKVSGMRLQVMELGEADASGRRKPVPVEGKFETLDLDSVIMAIGQRSNLEGLEELEQTKKGTIAADESTFRTNLEGVFAVGDVTNKGASIAIAAIGEAQKCANVVDGYLDGKLVGYKKPIIVEREITAEDLKDRVRIPREKMRTLSPEDRKHNFKEVALGFTDEQAKKEASRCLECGCLEYYRCKLVNYANKYNAEYEKFMGERSVAKKDMEHPYIMRDSGKCILCGLCVRVCSEVMDISAIGLAGRGFTTVVSPEFHKSLDVSKCISCGQCVALCPTGALIERTPFKKNLPFQEVKTPTFCTGCANACELNAYNTGKTLTRCAPADKNILCTEGRLGFFQMNNPDRLVAPLVDGKSSDINAAGARVREALEKLNADEIVVSVCDNMTNEELEAAKAVADKFSAKLVTLGNPKKTIKVEAQPEFERIFGEKYNLGINADKAKELGAVKADDVDLTNVKAVVSFGKAHMDASVDFKVAQSYLHGVKANVVFPIQHALEMDGTIGDRALTKVMDAPCTGAIEMAKAILG